jgi:ribonuclease M5
MKKIKYPIIVEGKYDKIKICSLFDATVITTGGFAIFSDSERLSLLRQLAIKSKKVILLTDSDGGGHLIRSHIKSAIEPDKIINLYTPKTQGKEKRKRERSKEGILGVEGTDSAVLETLLAPFCEDADETVKNPMTKADLYALGLSGREDSKSRREALLRALSLPHDMSPNAMLSALNILYSKEEIEEKANELFI